MRQKPFARQHHHAVRVTEVEYTTATQEKRIVLSAIKSTLLFDQRRPNLRNGSWKRNREEEAVGTRQGAFQEAYRGDSEVYGHPYRRAGVSSTWSKSKLTRLLTKCRVGRSVSDLVNDVRHCLEPDTAIRLKERRANKLKVRHT
jgi:hypothetical protein